MPSCAARARGDLRAQVEERYADTKLTEAQKNEEIIAELYREWAAARDATGPLMRVFERMRGFFRAMARAFRGQGYLNEAVVMERIASGRIGGRQSDAAPRGPDGRFVAHEARADDAADDADSGFAAEIMAELAQVDELFENPLSNATTLKGVFADIDPLVKVIGEVGMPEETAEMGASERFLLRTPKGADFYVLQTDDEVWLDVSRLAEGEGGSAIYAAVADYAYNTDRVFIGDPAGLSAVALRRRTDAMLSSALKHGTTRHLAPHEYQLRGDAALGVVPLSWQNGDDLANVRGLIEASIANVASLVPEIARARYDFKTGTFRSGEGKPISDGMLEAWASHPRIRAARAGRSTLKRSILLNTLARTPGEGRPGLLERALHQQRQLVGRTDLRRTFYSRMPMPSLSFAGLKTEAARDKAERGWFSNLLTDAMGGWSDRYNLLALAPGEPLFAELGRRMSAIQKYLTLKHEMGSERNERHALADAMLQDWRKLMRGKEGRRNNAAMMDLMHDATIAGIDPSRSFKAPARRPEESAADHAARISAQETAFHGLHPRFLALPEAFQAKFREVRDAYKELADAEEKAVIDNLRVAMQVNQERASREYEAEIKRIRDKGLEGVERDKAMETAARKLAAVKRTTGWSTNARATALRAQFESNRIEGPYFPLGRFGNYFVTVRDGAGKALSFSRFESERDQQRFPAEQRKTADHQVETGVLDGTTGQLREMVDPQFVADIEKLVGDAVKDDALMDAIWQRYLETMPDASIRKGRIHRQGTPGYSRDAFRVAGHKMFHGAHQIARLKYGMRMQNELEKARAEAEHTDDPNRAKLVLNEIEKRHAFTMNPQSSAWSAWATSAAFVYYLGATPAAAMVNLSQTTVVGIPLMTAKFKRASVMKVSRELMRALRDFSAGKGQAGQSKRLTSGERAAMQEAYRNGIIDKSQSHDLAGIAETGVEYSDLRVRGTGWAPRRSTC